MHDDLAMLSVGAAAAATAAAVAGTRFVREPTDTHARFGTKTHADNP